MNFIFLLSYNERFRGENTGWKRKFFIFLHKKYPYDFKIEIIGVFSSTYSVAYFINLLTVFFSSTSWDLLLTLYFFILQNGKVFLPTKAKTPVILKMKTASTLEFHIHFGVQKSKSLFRISCLVKMCRFISKKMSKFYFSSSTK